MMGDSATEVMVLQLRTPSFRDTMHSSPRWFCRQRGISFFSPNTLMSSRSTSFVRSGVIVHCSPRSRDVNNRLPPTWMVRGLWGERMKGVFQFQRIGIANSGSGTMFDSRLFSVGGLGRILSVVPA